MIDGSTLKALREERGHTQYTLASEVGCRMETISRAERGVGISADMAHRIANALGVPVSHLHGSNDRTPENRRAIQSGTAQGSR